MDGVNNAFCSSKEEYEIARLTTKCAGLQGKIDEQAAEIEKYKALCDQMGNALEWYCRQNEDPDSQEILEAWRSMK